MSGKKTIVLLVEDNMMAQVVAKKILQDIGCEVDVASSGEEAIRLTLEKEYDLIFMDIGLGDTDGYAVTRDIRRQNTANSKKPIVALTAHSRESVTGPGLESGMNEIMTKPLIAEDAKKIITQFVKQSD